MNNYKSGWYAGFCRMVHKSVQIPKIQPAAKSWVSFAKEPYKRDYTLQKRPDILRSLLIVAT